MFKFRRPRALILWGLPLFLGVPLSLAARQRPQTIAVKHGVNEPIVISGDGRFIATLGPATDFVNTYDFKTGRKGRIRVEGGVGTLVFLPDNTSLAARGAANMFDVRTGKKIPYRSPRPFLRAQTDGKIAANRLGRGRVELWDVATSKKLGLIQLFPWEPHSLGFSRDGQRMVVGYLGQGDNVAVYDVKTRKKLWGQPAPQNQGTFDSVAAAISPDGRTVAIGSQNGKIALFNAQNGALLHIKTLPTPRNQPHPPDATRTLAFSPDSKLLATGGWNGVSTWQVRGARLRRQLPGTGGVRFFPDGKRLASGAEVSKGQITIWNKF